MINQYFGTSLFSFSHSTDTKYAKSLNKVSPMDILEKFSTACIIEGEDKSTIKEISNKVKMLKKIGLDILPANRS